MVSSLLLDIRLVFFVSLVQVGFLDVLPGWLGFFNIVLVMLVFVLPIGGIKHSLIWSIGASFILDLFSFHFFGFYILIYFVVLLIGYYLLLNFFTNRSLYSFVALSAILSLVYTFAYNFLEIFSGEGWGAKSYLSSMFFAGVGKGVVVNLMGTVIIFYLINFISDRMKPVFIVKDQYKL